MLGTVLGVGAFVTILGLSETASGQISKQFNLLAATEVTVNDIAAGSEPGDNFPPDADARAERLPGVVGAGVWWQAGDTQPVSVTPAPAASQTPLPVYGATPGLLAAADAVIGDGTALNAFDDHTHEEVAVIGAAAAATLGLAPLVDRPAVLIDATPFTVIGIVTSSARLPQLSLGITVPASTAAYLWGAPEPARSAQMVIATRLGAAGVVASEAAAVIRPDQPGLLRGSAAQSPAALQHAVTTNLNSLLLALAAVAVVVGALGIANTTMVAILERAHEIGVRRALGARPVHIAAQFLAEAMTTGMLGGIVGTAGGEALVLVVTVAHHWTAVLQPAVVLLAPLGGGCIGLLAGAYPAIKAGRLEPTAALQR